MASISSNYESKIPEFLKKFNTGKDMSLDQIAKLGLTNINKETPVLSGNLKANNEYKVIDDGVVFYNDEDYSSHVELGTVNQSANPFMRRGLAKSKNGFIKILVKNFRVK